MKKLFLALAALFAFTLIPGCCGKLCAAEQEKKHTICQSWAIKDLPSATAKKIKPAPEASITFEKGKVYGCAGDNRFFGNVRIDGRKITFSHMGMTRMLGPNARYEGYFMEALNQVTQYDVDGDVRLLDKNGKVLMVLKPQPKVKKK